jgi:L-amino acid N-acyltransferase YncA
MIRPYQESDLPDIVELLNLLKESNEANKFEDVLFDPETYKETYLVKRTYRIFVKVENERIVGFILGEHYSNNLYAIIMLYVHPDWRRKQIALKLKTALTDYAKENSYKQIISQVRTNNLESIKMNQRAGWEIVPDKVYPDYYVECSKNL